MALNVIKVLLVTSVLSLVGCGGGDEEVEAPPPALAPSPPPPPSGGGGEAVCEVGEEKTQSCSADIQNSLIATQTLSCKVDRSGFDVGTCNVESCQTGFMISGNSCIPEPVCETGYIENNECVVPSVPPIIVTEGLEISGEHPRILFNQERLQTYLSKLSGEDSMEPFSTIFDKIKTREVELKDNPAKAGLMNLSLLYLVSEEETYLETYLIGLDYRLNWLDGSTVRVFDHADIVSMDLLWSHIPSSTKLRVLEQASKRFGQVDTQGFNYHGAYPRNQLLLLAGLLIEDPIFNDVAVTSEPEKYSFSPADQLIYLQSQIEDPSGEFRQYERRIAGDMTYNSALEGEFGGMYDNFGYDTSEESTSMLMIRIYQDMFGKNVADEFLHDKYRGLFYQNMMQPDGKAPRIWRKINGGVTGPDEYMGPIAADSYKDGRMQYYAKKTVNSFVEDNAEYIIQKAGFTMYFYDPDLQSIAPSDNPTSRYFSGPGFVPMKSSHSPDAAYGLFMSGEGISRRYEDINSFTLFKNEEAVIHAGARFRFSNVNERHHTFAKSSLSKNTIRVIDPLESLDQDAIGNRGELYDGVQIGNEYNFGGQLAENQIKSIDGSSLKRNTVRGVENLYNSGDITRYEHVENEYTYTRGKGEFNYTKKINQFDREFVFIPPETFITFDRLNLENPQHQKIWNIHTVYEPVFQDGAIDTSHIGVSSSINGKSLLARGKLQQLHVENLLPENSLIEVRGGESYLAQDLVLNSGQGVDESSIASLDTGRSVEFIVQGVDLEGTITVTGDTAEQDNVSEELVYSSNSYITIELGQATDGSATQIQDNTKNWKTDEFKGARVAYNGNGAVAVITGNNSNTLFGEFPAGWQYWRYKIEKVLVSTENRFTNITSVSTNDMSVSDLDLRVLHYFDSVAADGTLHSFAPQSDGNNDDYEGQKEYGRYTINVISNNESSSEYFLNVMKLQEVGDSLKTTINVSSSSAGGLIIDSFLIVFAKDLEDTPNELEVDIQTNEVGNVLVIGLEQGGLYFLERSDTTISIASSDNGGLPLIASDMGTISYSFE